MSAARMACPAALAGTADQAPAAAAAAAKAAAVRQPLTAAPAAWARADKDESASVWLPAGSTALRQGSAQVRTAPAAMVEAGRGRVPAVRPEPRAAAEEAAA